MLHYTKKCFYICSIIVVVNETNLLNIIFMKRTMTANISGTSFMLDEDAYRELNAYMDDISARLSGQDGREDIVDDIESRISELLHEWGAGGLRVVTLSMVDRVKATIGDPEIFGDPDFGKTYKNDRPMGKKLMRDTRHKVLGGVCSGLGLYFGIGAAVMRALALILIICFGTGVMAYIILWIVMPKPKTSYDFRLLEEMDAKQTL